MSARNYGVMSESCVASVLSWIQVLTSVTRANTSGWLLSHSSGGGNSLNWSWFWADVAPKLVTPISVYLHIK